MTTTTLQPVTTPTPVTLVPRRAAVSVGFPDIERAAVSDLVAEIEELKQARNAAVLAHNYMTPDIFHTVADVVGDSLALARAGVELEADVLVFAGVHFMAETAAILSPDKRVLIPDLRAGCSLASSITATDVLALRAAHPGAPVVTYVNSTAAVKAVSDACATSSNALEVVESFGVDKVIFVPDRFLAANVAAQTDVEIVTHPGACEVHERFTAADIAELREGFDGLEVVAHPECPPEVVEAADFAGSTSAMIAHVAKRTPKRVALITECSMSDNVAVEFPDVEFVRPCNLCPHMKRITLAGIRDSLVGDVHVVEVAADVAAPARRALEYMLSV